MAFPSSYIAAPTLRDAVNNVIPLGLNSDGLNVALYNSSFAGGVFIDDPAFYGNGSYASNEVTGTNWAAGGVALTNTKVNAITSTGGTSHGANGVGINFNANNVSVIFTTVPVFAGCVIYDTTVTASLGNVICAINFNGSYTTVNGLLSISWGTAHTIASIFYIQLGPTP